MIKEITQRQFSLRGHVLLIGKPSCSQGHTRTDLKPSKWCWKEAASAQYLCVQGVSDEVKWNRQHAQGRPIPKRPLLLEELVTSKTPFYRSVLYFANLLLCSAAILPKGERKKGSEKIVRRKAALLQEPEPVTEMQKAKPGLLVTSVKRWFIQSPSQQPPAVSIVEQQLCLKVQSS